MSEDVALVDEVIDPDEEFLITVTRPGAVEPFAAYVTPNLTVNQLIESLLKHYLPAAGEGSTYELRSDGGKLLNPTMTVEEAGLGEGSQLVANRVHTGAGLSPELLAHRLQHDHKLMLAVNASPAPVQATGYSNSKAAETGVGDPVPEGSQNPPAYYRLEYSFPVLANGNGGTLDGFVAVMGVLANGNYPATAPLMRILRPVPYAHRVSQRSGVVCMGRSFWTPNRSTIVEAAYQLGRYMNLDEPRPRQGEAWDHGYNSDAADYWEQKLDFEPLNHDLSWPLPSIQPPKRQGFRPANVPGATAVARPAAAPRRGRMRRVA